MEGMRVNAAEMYAASKSLSEAYAAVMAPLARETGLAGTAVDILLFLANNPGKDTAKDICTMRGLKPGIVSFHVENLAREGYLARRAVPGDRRKSGLTLTEKADAVVVRGRAMQKEFAAALTEGIDQRALAVCFSCLERMRENAARMADGK